jgi:hypothetical protein
MALIDQAGKTIILECYFKRLNPMKKTVVTLLLIAAVLKISAQVPDAKSPFDVQPPESTSKANLGLGLGLDYGGIGGRFSFQPSSSLALFAGLGYNFAGAGFNAGGIVRLAPEKRITPTLLAMYGYNAVIVVKGDDFDETVFSRTYYGPSFGAGVEFHQWHKRGNFFNLQLLVPVRSRKFHDDMDALKASEFIDINEPWPVTICLGYHWGF